jgi:8-oxo-dGTP pyrophosphatase MutT (NUDIX family)
MDEHSAGAVVARLDPRRYLLLQYRGGHWGHVKGHVEEAESLRETVVREAEEETGLDDLSFIDGFREAMTYTFHRGDEPVEKRVDVFLTVTEESDVEVLAPQEHTDIGWFSYEEALEQVTFDEAREVLEAAHEHLDEVQQASLERFEG